MTSLLELELARQVSPATSRSDLDVARHNLATTTGSLALMWRRRVRVMERELAEFGLFVEEEPLRLLDTRTGVCFSWPGSGVRERIAVSDPNSPYIYSAEWRIWDARRQRFEAGR